jgi:lysophospholipid acyltransferase (LPLAT)-like uncharacterized protein
MSTVEPAPPSPAGAFPRKVLHGWQRTFARLAGNLIHLWVRTLRITASSETEKHLSRAEGPTLFVLWHNRLFVVAEIARTYRRGRPLHALISTSKDGAWLTEFFATVGLSAVRGSSSKGGREAARELVQVLKEGGDGGITPDGPRGPCYVAKPGALIVARRSGATVVLLGVAYASAWRLRSWDKFYLPLPFSRVHFSARIFSASDLEAEDGLERLERALKNMNPEPLPETDFRK